MKQITEDYVSFETAKLLKEKGFDGECDYWYGEYGEICCSPSVISVDCWCPTQSLALKWLRKVRKIHIAVNMGCDIDNVNYTFYMPIIVKFNNKSIDYIDPFGEEENEFDSNEEAVEAALKYTLENLI